MFEGTVKTLLFTAIWSRMNSPVNQSKRFVMLYLLIRWDHFVSYMLYILYTQAQLILLKLLIKREIKILWENFFKKLIFTLTILAELRARSAPAEHHG